MPLTLVRCEKTKDGDLTNCIPVQKKDPSQDKTPPLAPQKQSSFDEAPAKPFLLARVVAGDPRPGGSSGKRKDPEAIERERRECNDRAGQKYRECYPQSKVEKIDRKRDRLDQKYEEKARRNGGTLSPGDHLRFEEEKNKLADEYGEAQKPCQETREKARKKCWQEYQRAMAE